MSRIQRYALVVALTLVSAVSGQAMAQNLVGPGSMAQRPGEMLASGIADQQATVVSPRLSPQISEAAPVGVRPRDQFLVDAFQTIFDQLNQAILLWSNILSLQLGGSVQLPISLPTVPDLTAVPDLTPPQAPPTAPTAGTVDNTTIGASPGLDATGGQTVQPPATTDPINIFGLGTPTTGLSGLGQLGGRRGGQRAKAAPVPGTLKTRIRQRMERKTPAPRQ